MGSKYTIFNFFYFQVNQGLKDIYVFPIVHIIFIIYQIFNVKETLNSYCWLVSFKHILNLLL